MNVTDYAALELVRRFARIEFALKTFPEFVNGQPGDTPGTQWSAFYGLARGQVAAAVDPESRRVLLGSHLSDPPPKKMVVLPDRSVGFVDAPLEGPEGDRLMDAARRVRNNLVHGGKERRLQERYPGHDQQLVVAALDVIYCAAAAHSGVAALFFID